MVPPAFRMQLCMGALFPLAGLPWGVRYVAPDVFADVFADVFRPYLAFFEAWDTKSVGPIHLTRERSARKEADSAQFSLFSVYRGRSAVASYVRQMAPLPRRNSHRTRRQAWMWCWRY